MPTVPKMYKNAVIPIERNTALGMSRTSFISLVMVATNSKPMRLKTIAGKKVTAESSDGIIAGKVRHVLENTEYNIGYDTNLKIKPIFMSKEESVDIDDPIDLELCRLMAGDYDK